MRVGELTRIAWPLTGSVCSFIVRSIPEGLMFREFSSIWEIQVQIHLLVLDAPPQPLDSLHHLCRAAQRERPCLPRTPEPVFPIWLKQVMR